ncbi:aspartate-alanine antiporter [Mangrovactinospora gilvigrisea]|uniref:aspartate-alanine antiporter n=1 Tax=Mangrovactinospora gilvigrisea TaxID=1428644 RepID=UPI000A96FE3F|nr:aspartate-alanine antiporter [Mangrovactinospora gilvigrisea]
MHWLTEHIFKPYPELLVFITTALGFLFGKVRWKAIALGSVTGCLIAGLLLGWATGVSVDNTVKAVFFDLFLFALGYKVGPQFFRGLKKDGLPQVAVTLVVCFTGLGVCWGFNEMLGYGPGLGAGLLGGALTQSAVIGVAQDAIGGLSLSHSQIAAEQNYVPIGYAVTYPLGTILCAILLANIAPRMLRKDLRAESAELGKELDVPAADPDLGQGYYETVLRAYRAVSDAITGLTIDAFERQQKELGRRVYITQVRRDGAILDHNQQTVVRADDTLAVSALRADLVDLDPEQAIGPETDDMGLLGYRTEHLHVVASDRQVLGRSIAELRGEPYMVGVYIEELWRSGTQVPFRLSTTIDRGDTLVLSGPRRLVEPAAKEIGVPVPTRFATDMVWVGLGVFLGGCIGIPALHVGGVPISLSTSGGALIMGLVFGWIKGRYPTFGNVPPGAQWFMDTLGLCLFVVVVGINAGPSFSSGLAKAGWGLLLWGAVATVVPLLVGLVLGHFVMRIRTPILMGVLAGAQTTTAAIGAITEAADSEVPTLGYTVPYAVGNVLLTIWGAVIVALLA